MAREIDQDAAKRPQIPRPYAILTVIQVVITDIFLYGCLIPLIGSWLAGLCAYQFNFSPRGELVLTVILTFSLIYGTFLIVGEANYWKHLFAFDKFYCVLLQIRDGVNAVLLVGCLLCIACTLEAIVTQDKGMKQVQMSEGVVYVFLKAVCKFLHVDEAFLHNLGLKSPRKGTLMDPSFGENEKYEHGALYMLYWGILTGCVAKLVYFNTLFTYLRAMEIFISMKPMFGEDDDVDSSTSLLSSRQSRQTRLETNFARSIRRLNWDD